MHILYGIQTTGLGHLSRSLKIIKSLEKRGHVVDTITSGPDQNILDIPSKHHKGFSFIKNSRGEISITKTLFGQDFSQLYRDVKNFPKVDYDFIISDFEPISSWISKTRGIPLFSVSNQSNFLSNKYTRPTSLLAPSEVVMKISIPFGIPIGFHWKPFDNFIYKPIIRDEIFFASDRREENYYLIYINNMKVEYMIGAVERFVKENFIIYSPELYQNNLPKNIKIKQLNFESFTKDLINCKGVITNAGFSTITESIFLGKKLMSVPQKNQWEQLCNAYDLAKDGFFIDDSLDNLDKFIESPKTYIEPWSDPSEDIVDEILFRIE
jgi:uncharacterized protein (TIGR00661 family)